MTITKKSLVTALLCFFLATGSVSTARAMPSFLSNQSYHFGGFDISGTDGTVGLFKYYSTSQFFRVVAYQIVDDKADNVIHVLAVIDNSGIPWGNVTATEVTTEVVSTADVSGTSSTIASATPGYVDILVNDNVTVPDGVQTINVTCVLSLTDGSIMQLESTIKLSVK